MVKAKTKVGDAVKVAICDDEQICIDQLVRHLKEYCGDKRLLVEISAFTSPALFMESNLVCYDVVFLDANMGSGNMNGIEAARALRQVNNRAILVYVSAYLEYAPMGYEVDAFRYLIKGSLDATFSGSMEEIVQRLEMKQKQILLATKNGDVSVTISELCYIESFRHQIMFYMKDASILESKQHTMAQLTELLTPHAFLRIHKSYLVNPEHISVIKNRAVILKSGGTLSCGKLDYAQTLQSFALWKGAR